MKIPGACFNLLIWKGVFWAFSSDFWTIFHFSVIFWGGFSLFCLFSGSAIRYTRTQESRLYYRSSKNCFAAGRPSALCCQKIFILGTFLNLGCTLLGNILHHTRIVASLLMSNAISSVRSRCQSASWEQSIWGGKLFPWRGGASFIITRYELGVDFK
jgi:hypothetical protein